MLNTSFNILLNNRLYLVLKTEFNMLQNPGFNILFSSFICFVNKPATPWLYYMIFINKVNTVKESRRREYR